MSDYETALRLMKSSAPNIFKVRLLLESAVAQSDDRAEYALATWYLHGQHVEKDLDKGIRLLERAVLNNNVEAAFDLAVCYERGLGVAKSEAKAFRLYETAAHRGDRKAMNEVGRMLYYGLGVEQDLEAADRWLASAERTLGETESLNV